jgi:hypothetical protein
MSGQGKSDYIKLGLVRTCKFRLGHVCSDYDRLVQVTSV